MQPGGSRWATPLTYAVVGAAVAAWLAGAVDAYVGLRLWSGAYLLWLLQPALLAWGAVTVAAGAAFWQPTSPRAWFRVTQVAAAVVVLGVLYEAALRDDATSARLPESFFYSDWLWELTSMLAIPWLPSFVLGAVFAAFLLARGKRSPLAPAAIPRARPVARAMAMAALVMNPLPIRLADRAGLISHEAGWYLYEVSQVAVYAFLLLGIVAFARRRFAIVAGALLFVSVATNASLIPRDLSAVSYVTELAAAVLLVLEMAGRLDKTHEPVLAGDV